MTPSRSRVLMSKFYDR